MIYLRALFSAVATVLVTIMANIGCALSLVLSRHGSYAVPVTRWWARSILWAGGVKTTVHGDASPKGGPFLIVANHSSMLDICATAGTIRLDFRSVSRPYFFKIPFLGWGMWAGRQIALDPQKPREAARVLKELGSRFKLGISVLLYPEGTRSPDGKIQKYKRGPFLTAIQNGVPILPIALVGAHARLPKKALRIRPGPLAVTFGEPIPTAGLKPPDARRLAAQVETWTRQVHDRRAHGEN